MFRLSTYCEVGDSHIQWGKGCEDTTLSGADPETGVSAVVVSDGAGSCQYAKDGSAVTAETALAVLLAHFEELYTLPEAEAAELLLGTIRGQLAKRAGELDSPMAELSATLVCAAMAPDGRWLHFHVGDGIVAACDEHGQCCVLSQYCHTIARNYTTFVTIPDTAYHLGRGQGGVAAFLLTSDGPEYLMTFDDGWMTAQAALLIQMGMFFPPERMEDEMRQITAYFKSLGMYDDASFAMLADRRCAPGVFDGMNSELRRMIFYLPDRHPRRVLRQIHDCFALLAAHPEGVPEAQMTRALRTHNKWNTFHKLVGPLTAESIRLAEGKYYFY